MSGFVPAPMIFGALIDSTCRLWQTDSSACPGSASSGNCLLFDTDQLRWRVYGVVLAVQLVQLILSVLLYYTVKHRKFSTDEVISTQMLPPSPPVQDGDGNAPPTFDEVDQVEMTEMKW